jgi:AcrR family transcriptional regulator
MQVFTEKKEKIINTTLRLITTRGFHDTPMSLIAKEAEVAAGTIYHYFNSKEALINELYSTLKARMGEALQKNDQRHGRVKDRFFQFWKNLYQHFITHPEEFKFLEQYANSPLVDQDIREDNTRHYEPILTFMQEGMEAGVLRQMPVLLMANLVYGHIVITAKLALSGDLRITEEVLQQAIQASWDGAKIN